MNQQLATSLIGPMNVTRAVLPVLPVLRQQKAGRILTISSTTGLVSFEFCGLRSLQIRSGRLDAFAGPQSSSVWY